MAIDKELKKEILKLPAGEKDKLLLRLVAKDRDLVERLQFVLIENEATTEERRKEVKERIAGTAIGHYSHPDGWLLKAMRSLSTAVTHHVKITKDKYGDIELNLYLLNAFFDAQPSLFRVLNRHNEHVCAFVAKKADAVLKKLTKLDPDYFIEFETDVNRALGFIHSGGPGAYARNLGLPKRWPNL
ncbi:hypothetical protein [Larkinella soli]|uniref:hypothetical protein n=1 Tax=Larkinella soli TaxID=1770527 RepID=UPI001E60472C|nr:hypothetical protein [Larkinella soli]